MWCRPGPLVFVAIEPDVRESPSTIYLAVIAMRNLFLVALMAIAHGPSVAQTASAHLELLAPFVGKTWQGEFAHSTPEHPVIDVSKWEWALNGQAIRILHSVNDGHYGGETIVMWNPDREALVGHYFTTAGFMTTAIITPEEDGLTSREEVVGHDAGVTAVEARMRILPDGRLHSASRYLRHGTWEDGHEITYTEAPHAKVRFRDPAP